MILVLDTNAYSAFECGDEALVDLLERCDEIIVPSVVAGELMAGFLMGRRWTENWKNLLAFLEEPGVRFHPQGMAEAEKYGMLVKSLRESGKPVPTNDIWIAATVLTFGAAVLTRDAHYGNFAGLSVVGW